MKNEHWHLPCYRSSRLPTGRSVGPRDAQLASRTATNERLEEGLSSCAQDRVLYRSPPALEEWDDENQDSINEIASFTKT